MLLALAVAGAAGLGAVARYLLDQFVGHRVAGEFPYGTLVINIAGSLVLGFVLRYGTGATVLSPQLRAGLSIGFCGAFTTMSTFSYESMALLSDGEYWRAGLYMAATIVGCLGAVIAGTWAANRLL